MTTPHLPQHGSSNISRNSNGNGLGEFLRARRALLSPAQAHLPGHGQRRVPGLRREEVASLAGLSTDYYTRLEQGRERGPSRQVLDALAGGLRLDEEARTHLHRLVHPTAGPLRPPVERVSPGLLGLLDGWPDTPAYVLGHALDVLALNPLAAALFGDFERTDNLQRMVFLDPAARRFHRDWDRAAASSAAALRTACGAAPGSPRTAQLVAELTRASPEFARLWARHEVGVKTHEAKAFHHTLAGDLTLHFETLTVNAAPGQQLVVYRAEPGTPSHAALALLGAG
ncbi:helix-turn-helix transcriptional regulator [Streptomyces sp. NBC_00536]|uniref:helix-turn-helix transcriptional regulator n=1 Tax=Streptomyces sp. NBC_00536 TaxID=2975769 RepID=UPI002E80C2DD|nr:helix-turn-helix transcriptional regulator [Streptomyces sp. NBC_00536]WUC82903.1 helix-turn-helix transcriptional regulator [Streptomyces sp. NBC_00536]